jgi:hypothetical protein
MLGHHWVDAVWDDVAIFTMNSKGKEIRGISVSQSSKHGLDLLNMAPVIGCIEHFSSANTVCCSQIS